MKYFNFEQWAVSSIAKQKGIDNSVPSNFYPRIKELVEKILDPLREAWGSDIIVTSGYRSATLLVKFHVEFVIRQQNVNLQERF